MEYKQRLASLDILRGADMWLLLMLGPIISSFLEINQNPSLDGIRYQFSHVPWEGFAIWDIIMPLFMFLSGATIPFSMSKYNNGATPGYAFYIKLIKRFVMLFFLGWIVQGNLLTLEPKLFHPYANTLQSIAVGYVISALIFVYGTRIRTQIILTIIPFLLYVLAFVLTGMNLDPQENIAMLADKYVLGAHRDGVIWENGVWSYAGWYQYTWILSSLNFTVTAMLGCFSGQIIKSERPAPQRKAFILLTTGVALMMSALLMSSYFPIIKKIWSSSMTLFAGGISFILISVFYYYIDVKSRGGWLKWLKIYGMNSIAAYMIGEVINFSSVSKSLLFGFENILGAYYPMLITTANAFILFFILKLLYRKGLFFKV